MRYLTQRDRFRCAAIAVINALKWQGKRATYEDALRLSKQWGITRQAPASDEMIQKALRLPCKILTEKQVRSAIEAGHAVIVSTFFTVNGILRGHAWFCPGFITFGGKPVEYFGVNVFEGEARSLVSWADMEKILRLGSVWVIKR